MTAHTLTVGTTTYSLEFTLDAFRTIPASLGGFVGAYAKLSQADVDTCVLIIAAATGKARDFEAQEKIAEALFREGLKKDLFDTLTKYLTYLQNAGKAPAPRAGGETNVAGE